MLRKDIVPDRVLDQKVGRQLANRGMRPPCKVVVSSKGGAVTLAGTIQYEHQRNLCVRAARNVEGVQRVVDQLQVIAKTSHWDGTPPCSNPRP